MFKYVDISVLRLVKFFCTAKLLFPDNYGVVLLKERGSFVYTAKQTGERSTIVIAKIFMLCRTGIFELSEEIVIDFLNTFKILINISGWKTIK